ncbi:AAA family ATPase [Streptomyces sp. RTGN2]|uniref:AAA family ATPase n=1 Tax=unclassified Streptomyces TaxID=2593676 RepID=UPI002554CDA0|nr:AAA family ATPase [Streptomyces sp. RTGN2]
MVTFPFSQPTTDTEPVQGTSDSVISSLATLALRSVESDRAAIREGLSEGDRSRFDLAVMVQEMSPGAPRARRQLLVEDYLEKMEARAEAEATFKQRQEDAQRAASGAREQFLKGGADFILDAPEAIAAVWGDGDDILLAEGEALMLVGKAGVGKTTVANQFIRARLGITDKALGFTVQPTQSKVLYLACDRPRQAARAMCRLFRPEDREHLAKLQVWEGPPAFDFAQHTDAMLNMCLEAGADTIIVDSLKDVAIGLSEDGVGSAYNRARQLCLVNSIAVIELHHQVKRGANGADPNSIADVYGSTWLTAGAGSVILLDGDAGDPVVKLKHLKQPVNTIGPVDLIHDHEAGVSTLADQADLIAVARARVLTAHDAARLLFDTDKPTKAEKEKARRKLDAYVKTGQLRAVGGDVPGQATTYASGLSFVPSPTVSPDADGDADGSLFGDAAA